MAHAQCAVRIIGEEHDVIEMHSNSKLLPVLWQPGPHPPPMQTSPHSFVMVF